MGRLKMWVVWSYFYGGFVFHVETKLVFRVFKLSTYFIHNTR